MVCGQPGPTILNATLLADTAYKSGPATALIRCRNMVEKIVQEIALAP